MEGVKKSFYLNPLTNLQTPNIFKIVAPPPLICRSRTFFFNFSLLLLEKTSIMFALIARKRRGNGCERQ